MFHSAGLGAYADKISQADKMLITLDRMKIECKDGQAYRLFAKKFFEAVDEASVAVEEGKVELERIERERADREHWLDRLDDLKACQDHVSSVVSGCDPVCDVHFTRAHFLHMSFVVVLVSQSFFLFMVVFCMVIV